MATKKRDRRRERQDKTKCDYPGCTTVGALRIDIKTSWFRGDDVVLHVCKEHRREEHHQALLETPKAQRQMT